MRSLRAVAVVCLFLCALPLYAQNVKVNWQTGAPFAAYKTFAWQDPKTQTVPFYGPWVKADAIAELQAKGLTQAAAGQKADLIVTYHMQGQELVDATSSDGWIRPGQSGPGGGGCGWGGGWGGWGAVDRRFDDDYVGASAHDSYFDRRSGGCEGEHAGVSRDRATVENVSGRRNRETKSRPSSVCRRFSRAIRRSRRSSEVEAGCRCSVRVERGAGCIGSSYCACFLCVRSQQEASAD